MAKIMKLLLLMQSFRMICSLDVTTDTIGKENSNITVKYDTNGTNLTTVEPVDRSVATKEETSTQQSEKEESQPYWSKALDITQIVCSVTGFVANMVTFLTLSRSSSGLGVPVVMLLRHQSVVDAIICLMASLLMMAPPMWVSGDDIFDDIVCHVWHSQALYWQLYLASIWNLVMISIERFLCVGRPLDHHTLLSPGRIRKAIILIQFFSLIGVSPGYIQTRFSHEDGICLSEFAFPGETMNMIFYIYGFIVFALYNMIPVILFVVFYGYVIMKLKGRIRGDHLPKSAVIQKASEDLTKTAIVVTIIFIVSTSWDVWSYLLGRTGVIEYIKNSPLQKTGVFLSILNCCANPFVYVMFMPAYRRNVAATLMCKAVDDKGNVKKTSQNLSGSAGTNSSNAI